MLSPKWVKNNLTNEHEHCIIYNVQGDHTEPGLPAVTDPDEVVLVFSHIDFYRIKVFYNTDQTIDAFLYLRIPKDSTYRAKNYSGDEHWDLSAAKLDLLADGTTLRKLLSAIAVDPMNCQLIMSQIGFTGIGDCTALDDIAYADYVDSEKIMDMFLDDGCSSSIRCIFNAKYINESKSVSRFFLS